jgi:hypothetical protein
MGSSSLSSNGAGLRLPDFIHVGPPRTGTTWLHEVLAGHVGLPRGIKETSFFDDRYDLGLKWYAKFFADYPSTLPVGEMAPTYFSNNLARARIRKDLPNCKIICTFREPAARLYSLYRMFRAQRNQMPPTFDRYWRMIVAGGIDCCTYASDLERWYETFGRDRVLVLFYDDLNANPQGILDHVCNFIGIERVLPKEFPAGEAKVYSKWSGARSNVVSRYALDAVSWIARHGGSGLLGLGKDTRVRQMVRRFVLADFEDLSESSAEELREVMLPDIEALERLTGRDLASWKPTAQLKSLQVEESVRARLL